MSLIITAYNHPDLDGVACSYAYAELLKFRGEKALVAFSGNLQSEARYIADYLKIKFGNLDGTITGKDQIILVDASEADMLNSKIKIENVIELIDHRKVNSAHLFPGAKIQIEMVGSCATLICEKFISAQVKPSRESAILLYCAIISNTINFKANVTTDRDHRAAEFLLKTGEIPENIIHEMFEYKSKIDDPIELIFPDNLKSDTIGGKRISIFQIEIIGVEEFIQKNHGEIVEFLRKTNDENNFDHTFLTCIDLEKGVNTFVASDLETQKMLEDIYDVKFENSIAIYPKIIMRKEIKPKLKEYLEGLV